MGEPAQRVVTVLVVDDQPLLRQGIRAVLNAEPGIRVVGEARDGVDAVRAVQRLRPDVTLMDLAMPRMDGIEATRRIVSTATAAETKVVVLTMYDQDEQVFAALRAGASGLVLKDAPTTQMVDAIRQAADGHCLLSPTVTRRLIEEFVRRPVVQSEDASAPVTLTDRERDVFRLMVQGLSNAETAAHLALGDSTVKSHVQSLYRKLGVRDRVQVVIYAYENGLVHHPPPPSGGGGDRREGSRSPALGG